MEPIDFILVATTYCCLPNFSDTIFQSVDSTWTVYIHFTLLSGVKSSVVVVIYHLLETRHHQQAYCAH